MSPMPTPQDLEEIRPQFMAKVMPEPNSGCWLWIGTITSQGYGVISLKVGGKHKQIRAHRLSYENHVGPIPAGSELDHLCRVRCCVNPQHLEAVSTKTNVLRGHGLAAINQRKTICIHGHPLTPDNLRPDKLGYRRCAECCRQNHRKWKQKRAAGDIK